MVLLKGAEITPSCRRRVSLKYWRPLMLTRRARAVAQAGHHVAVEVEGVDVEEGVAQGFVRFQQAGSGPADAIGGHFFGQRFQQLAFVLQVIVDEHGGAGQQRQFPGNYLPQLGLGDQQGNAASAYAGKQHQGNHQGSDLEFEAEKEAGKRPHGSLLARSAWDSQYNALVAAHRSRVGKKHFYWVFGNYCAKLGTHDTKK
jgi:hypothetical protein